MHGCIDRESWHRGWDGWKSCAQWLSWRTGIGLDAAREKVRVARALPGLPRVAAAFERGALSYSKVRALTRIATPAMEEALLKIAIHGTASQLERVVRGYRRADAGRETARAKRNWEERYLRTRWDEHGNLLIEGRLPADLGARFLQALDAAVDAAHAEEAAGVEELGDRDAFPRKGATEKADDGVAFPQKGATTTADGGSLGTPAREVPAHSFGQARALPRRRGGSRVMRRS